MLFATNEAKTSAQSLLAVYFQAVVYYDQILSYFCLAFQYLLFIYKYNVLYYSTSTIAGELILLTLLLLLNPLRLTSASSGAKGRKTLLLLLFFLLDILFLLGCVYVAALQSSALYMEEIIAIIALIFAGSSLLLGIVLAIYYRATD